MLFGNNELMSKTFHGKIKDINNNIFSFDLIAQ